MFGDDDELEYVFSIPIEVTRVFISGPMTGYPEWNHPLFNNVAMQLRVLGFTVVSPSEFFGGDTTLARKDYMRQSLIHLMNDVDMVLLLPGWSDSNGAMVEAAVGLELGLEIGELRYKKHVDDVF